MLVLQENGKVQYLNDFEINGYPKSRRIGRRFKILPEQRVGRFIQKMGLIGNALPVDVLDFSLSGAFICCKDKLKVNQKIEFTIELDNKLSKKMFSVNAKVIRKNAEYYYAIKFNKHLDEVELFASQYRLNIVERRTTPR